MIYNLFEQKNTQFFCYGMSCFANEFADIEFDCLERYIESLDKCRDKSEIIIVFAAALDSYPLEMTGEFVQQFVDKGLDINESSGHYVNDAHMEVTPLESACEFRYAPAIKALLRCGAKPKDGIITILITGHYCGASANWDSIDDIANLLDEYLSDNERDSYNRYLMSRTSEVEESQDSYDLLNVSPCADKSESSDSEIEPELEHYNLINISRCQDQPPDIVPRFCSKHAALVARQGYLSE